jgi:hypothetical protein
LVEFIAPMVENLIGGIGGPVPMLPVSREPVGVPIRRTASVPSGVSDYTTFNDYIDDPTPRQNKAAYSSSY